MIQSPPSLPIPERAAVVVMRAPTAEFFGPVTNLLWDAGLRCFEYTLTTSGALDALAEARAALPDAVLGVGTVRSPRDLEAADAAGAHFAVSQIFRPELVETAQERRLPFVPGALTPTEVANAWASGVPAVKVSPIGPLGGVSYLNELRGPLPDVALMPTGGVTLDSARAYLDAGAVAVGVSTALLGDALVGGDLAELKNRAQRLVDALGGA
jgi:2-dehydro-3-deoxyphosphogluconate aldolase/(4S)-4-hydroxy-2-oxoglutarate aldolase